MNLQIDEDTYIPVAQITYYTFTPKGLVGGVRAEIHTTDGTKHMVYNQRIADGIRRYVAKNTVKYGSD